MKKKYPWEVSVAMKKNNKPEIITLTSILPYKKPPLINTTLFNDKYADGWPKNKYLRRFLQFISFGSCTISPMSITVMRVEDNNEG